MHENPLLIELSIISIKRIFLQAFMYNNISINVLFVVCCSVMKIGFFRRRRLTVMYNGYWRVPENELATVG